jgi:hypothetical protein
MRRVAKAIDHYQNARTRILSTPWAPEIETVARLNTGDVTEEMFLRETAWVILNSGFRESVVRKHFSNISLCFCDWESASAILERADSCKRTARMVFRNERKLNAIVRCAELIAEEGFDVFWKRVQADPIRVLQSLPFIGKITVWHLAKNLGFGVAKPDRHLQRLAGVYGFADAHELCSEIAAKTGDLPSVIDAVLWRYEASQPFDVRMAA